MGVFNDHNGVVNHDSQGEQKGKQHDKIQAKPNGWHNQKGYKTRKWYRQTNKYGIGGSHKEH